MFGIFVQIQRDPFHRLLFVIHALLAGTRLEKGLSVTEVFV